MKLADISVYLEKTLTVYHGDEVTNCRIGCSKSLDYAIFVPKDTVGYKVQDNSVEFDAVKSTFEFIYTG